MAHNFRGSSTWSFGPILLVLWWGSTWWQRVCGKSLIHGSRKQRKKEGQRPQYPLQGHMPSALTSFYLSPPSKVLPPPKSTRRPSLCQTGLWGTLTIQIVTVHKQVTGKVTRCQCSYQCLGQRRGRLSPPGETGELAQAFIKEMKSKKVLENESGCCTKEVMAWRSFQWQSWFKNVDILQGNKWLLSPEPCVLSSQHLGAGERIRKLELDHEGLQKPQEGVGPRIWTSERSFWNPSEEGPLEGRETHLARRCLWRVYHSLGRDDDLR